LLRVRWPAVLAIADELERRTLIMAADVDRLCRAAGARKVGEHRTRPFDPDKHFVSLPGGKKVTMRQWADAVALSGFSQTRAVKLLTHKVEGK
jgi:hypothetical protein